MPDYPLKDEAKERRGEGMLAYIYPVRTGLGGTPEQPWVPPTGGGTPEQPWVPPTGGESPQHPIYGGPSQPIELPPLPGVWPPAGQPSHPIHIPAEPSQPIIIPGDPQHPIALPPGSVWPPLPPTTTGEYAILILVLGVGYRWLIVDAPTMPPSTLPAQPKPQPKS